MATISYGDMGEDFNFEGVAREYFDKVAKKTEPYNLAYPALQVHYRLSECHYPAKEAVTLMAILGKIVETYTEEFESEEGPAVFEMVDSVLDWGWFIRPKQYQGYIERNLSRYFQVTRIPAARGNIEDTGRQEEATQTCQETADAETQTARGQKHKHVGTDLCFPKRTKEDCDAPERRDGATQVELLHFSK